MKKKTRVKMSARAPLRKSEVRRLRRSLVRILAMMVGDGTMELSVSLVDETEITGLNRRYLGADGPTDVLAFPLMSPEELAEAGKRDGASAEPLGDIVICVPVAARQAASRGESLHEEMELLAAHGMLHLLGYEDETESGAGMMEATEKKLLGRSIVR